MDELLDQMKNGNNWSNKIIIDENKRFNGCYVFHEPIMSEKYANDLCIIDDTSCTNYYHLPLLLMISEDQNGRNQVLSFAIICSRTKNEFINYFVEIKQKIGDIRLFICDRNKTQVKALKFVFPFCKIIFCSVHISRNLRQKAGQEMCDLFHKLQIQEISEEEFINACNNYVNEHPKTKGSRLLQNLLEDQDKWPHQIELKVFLEVSRIY